MRNRLPLAVLPCLFGVFLIAGCMAPDETPETERTAAKRSVERASNAATESQKRVDEGNAVLDGK